MKSLQQDQSSAGIPSGPGDLLRWVRFRAKRTSSAVTLGAPAAAAVEGRRGEQFAAIASSTAWRLVGLQRGALEMWAKWAAAMVAMERPSVHKLPPALDRAGIRREEGEGANRGVSKGLGRSPQWSQENRRDW